MSVSACSGRLFVSKRTRVSQCEIFLMECTCVHVKLVVCIKQIDVHETNGAMHLGFSHLIRQSKVNAFMHQVQQNRKKVNQLVLKESNAD